MSLSPAAAKSSHRPRVYADASLIDGLIAAPVPNYPAEAAKKDWTGLGVFELHFRSDRSVQDVVTLLTNTPHAPIDGAKAVAFASKVDSLAPPPKSAPKVPPLAMLGLWLAVALGVPACSCRTHEALGRAPTLYPDESSVSRNVNPAPEASPGHGPLPFREAIEQAERRAFKDYSRACAGVDVLQWLRRPPLSLRRPPQAVPLSPGNPH